MCTTTSSCAHQLKQRIFVLIFLVLVTRSQTPFLYVRHDQVCPVALIRVIPFVEVRTCTLICAGYSRLRVRSIVNVQNQK